MKLVITNSRTKLSKVIDMENDQYLTHELQKIYDFYTNHETFTADVIHKGGTI